MIVLEIKLTKIVTTFLLLLFGLNLAFDMGIVKPAFKDSHTTTFVEDHESNTVSDALTKSSQENETQQHCSDPCHVGNCHFGHCAYPPAPVFSLNFNAFFLEYDMGSLSIPPTPVISGLKRPPRFS
ncbi:MAG: hypothetical protein SGJ18_00825 [Pseudomonadota bacterium]|nr:hypothetical protein [Pseudomonadota bacterium]